MTATTFNGMNVAVLLGGKAAEREMRVVQIHGRSRPPWIGDARSSGYIDLMPQTR